MPQLMWLRVAKRGDGREPRSGAKEAGRAPEVLPVGGTNIERNRVHPSAGEEVAVADDVSTRPVKHMADKIKSRRRTFVQRE